MSDIMTKRALENSLKNMLLKKPLNKITIQDIADDCGVNRMTFYYHFKDIYDLIEWSCMESAKKILVDNNEYTSWQKGTLEIFKYVKENKQFISNILHSIGKEQVEDFLYPPVKRIIGAIVDEEARNSCIGQEDKLFIAEFYQYAFVGIILKWVEDDMKESPESVVENISYVMTGNIKSAIKNFEQKNKN